MAKEFTPKEIVEQLDKYIIGQDNAKKAVAVALRNRIRRQKLPADMQEEVTPKNILMIGPTGVGKTEIARRLAKLVRAPFIKVEASKFTEVGYVGRDVESIVKDIMQAGVNMVRDDHMAMVKVKAEGLVEDRLLDLLVPPVRQQKKSMMTEEEIEQQKQETERFKDTREKFRQQLKRGEMEDKYVEINTRPRQAPMFEIMSGQSMEDIGMGLQDMMENLGGAKVKKKKVTIREARAIILEEETAKLVDMDKVTKEALELVQGNGIVFIDELDKIASSNAHGSGVDVSREGVQRDILPIVEGTTVMTKYGTVRTDHILFIAAGAFHVSKPSDLIPELQGRFPIRVELSSLTQNDFERILKEPENSLIKQYSALLETDDVKLDFDDGSITALAQLAFEVNETTENIGARRLHTIIEKVLEDVLFDAPYGKKEKRLVTKDWVEGKLKDMVKDRDLSKYIL
ncbi:MAG: HslU--HslV peptidase ATPase subunit [Candidatus Goldiibacteriota bacterium HGW-Goldbacteria-1]|nr:MAG: HslU--HslV peptidase ATPase subunit [Candidatus Goldiibacteriota bacterium HGW-Goldbacteria-1]